MSQWHARDGIADGNAYNVIYHIPIPSANNRVGVNYRAALIGSGIGGTTVMVEGILPGQIATAEKTSIATGAILEVTEKLDTRPSETANQLAARLDARYAELANVNGSFITSLASRLAYWGAASAS